jgi:hypothetical protein
MLAEEPPGSRGCSYKRAELKERKRHIARCMVQYHQRKEALVLNEECIIFLVANKQYQYQSF